MSEYLITTQILDAEAAAEVYSPQGLFEGRNRLYIIAGIALAAILIALTTIWATRKRKKNEQRAL